LVALILKKGNETPSALTALAESLPEPLSKYKS
jgi:hypothetical protein